MLARDPEGVTPSASVLAWAVFAACAVLSIQHAAAGWQPLDLAELLCVASGLLPIWQSLQKAWHQLGTSCSHAKTARYKGVDRQCQQLWQRQDGAKQHHAWLVTGAMSGR